MASNNGELFGSDSDHDEGFEADMEALRRACILTGTNPGNLQSSTITTTIVTATSNYGCIISEEDEEEGEDDLELVRNIQKRFSISTETAEPLTLKPLGSLPPVGSDDDYEDDIETLRAIQRRFAAYNDASEENSAEDYLHKSEQVGATNIASETETSNNLFVERTNLGEGFPDCVDTSIITTQNSLSTSDNVARTQHSGLIEWCESGAENVAISPVTYSSFPKSAQTFIDAIKKNRACQKFLRSKLMQIEARIEENKKLKERVKILKDFQVTCRKRTGRALSQKKNALVQLISVPKPRANGKVNEKFFAMHRGPAENSHVANYRMVLGTFLHSMNREKWSKEEKERLAKGIKQQFQEMLLKKSVDLLSGADGSSGDSDDFDNIMASIRDLDITPQNIRLFLPKVNWEQLASMYVPSRLGAECESRWLNCEDPLLSRNLWTRMEDKNLLHIVQQRGINNWIDIAVSLGTNRTPFQCLARYQRSLNASILKRQWTEDEDDKLRNAVEAFGENNWQLVASSLEGRTGTQCSNRWKKSLNPARRRVGKWTSDEDKHLKVSAMLFKAKNWNKIAQFVPGRTQVQCRERWVNCLDPSLNLDVWTEEENSRLKAAIEEHGYCWSKVAACVPPRTDSQCRRRWKVLLPHEVPLLQEARKIQKAAMISNFVDRESERPTIGPGDFVPLPEIESNPESENVIPHGKQKWKSRRRPEHNEKDGISGCVPKNRSKKHIEEAHICSEEVQRLTNGNEIENLHSQDANSRKKKLIKSLSKNKKSINSKLDHLSHSPDKMLLAITDGEEVGMSTGDVTMNKRTLGRRKQKSGRRRAESENIDACGCRTSVMKPCSKENIGSDPKKDHSLSCGHPNLLQLTNDEEVGEVGRDDVMESKKASKLQKNTRYAKPLEQVPAYTNSNVVETFGKKKGKGNKLLSKKNKVIGPKRDYSSPSRKKRGTDPTYLLMVTDEEVEAPGEDGSRKQQPQQMKRPCPRSEHIDVSIVSQSLPSAPNSLGTRTVNGGGGGGVETLGEDNEILEGSQNVLLPPRCSTPDILERGYTGPSTFRRQNSPKRSKTNDGSCNQLMETEDEDDVPIVSFLLQSGENSNSGLSSKRVAKLHSKWGGGTKKVEGSQAISLRKKCSTHDIPGNGNSSAGIGQASRPKRPRTINRTWSDQIEAEDDTTLASFCKKLKTTKA